MENRTIMAAMRKSGKIVILTGAGISKESGLSTFRDADGIWATVRIEDVATPEAFARDPDRVDAFYNARRARLLSDKVQPNAAHRALARLESEWPDEVLLVTQNIDNLHEGAGSRNVVHMHGELLKACCRACGAILPWEEPMTRTSACPACATLGELRVHVVWFGEMPVGLERIFAALTQADLFISIGTSGAVYPAAGFVAVAQEQGAHRVELNLEESEGFALFQEAHYGPASEIVPAYVDKILREGF